MNQMITMTALKPFTHAGRTYGTGDTLEAPPAVAASLHYQRKAAFTPSRAVRPRDLEPESDRASDTAIQKPKRQYRRRDLVPEP